MLYLWEDKKWQPWWYRFSLQELSYLLVGLWNKQWRASTALALGLTSALWNSGNQHFAPSLVLDNEHWKSLHFPEVPLPSYFVSRQWHKLYQTVWRKIFWQWTFMESVDWNEIGRLHFLKPGGGPFITKYHNFRQKVSSVAEYYKKKRIFLGRIWSQRNNSKDKRKDRKLALQQEVNRHDLTIKDIYQRNLNPIILWLIVHKEELVCIIKDKNQVYR